MSAGATFELLRDLPLTVEEWSAERLRAVVATRAFERRTTVFRLAGGGHEGRGEDVALDHADHDALPAPDELPAGTASLGEWCEALGDADARVGPPSTDAGVRSRRWALESAALDLALRQAGLSLGDAIGRRSAPFWFVASLRLGDMIVNALAEVVP